MCKSVAMSIAWYIQTIRSAFASALAGGLLMSKSTIHMLEKRGLVQAKDHSETYLDEILSYIVSDVPGKISMSISLSLLTER